MTPSKNIEPVRSDGAWPIAYVHNEILRCPTMDILPSAKREFSSKEMKIGNAARKKIAADPIPAI